MEHMTGVNGYYSQFSLKCFFKSNVCLAVLVLSLACVLSANGEEFSLKTVEEDASSSQGGIKVDVKRKMADQLDDGEGHYETLVRTTRRDRFYYCGPKDEKNHCRSLCYAMGYPYISCGRISCYCTF